MSNHDVECGVCKEDLRGLSGGHASGCPAMGGRKPITEEVIIFQVSKFGRVLK